MLGSGTILASRLLRVVRKPPRYVAERIWHEISSHAERFRAPSRARRLRADRLAAAAGFSSVEAWWRALAARPGPAAYETTVQPDEQARIRRLAVQAATHRVDLLGSGLVELGQEIDWSRDFKSGRRFAPAFCKDICYNDLDEPSDVKVPWELSRMQWLIPVGQAYVLDRNPAHAAAVRAVLEHWIDANPHAFSVNWACTMDVALRTITWLWLFQVFAQSEPWADSRFRSTFLENLYLHADFVSRHLEKSDVNGNHYTADAAGLAMAGQFLADLPQGRAWRDKGWEILRGEIELQVFADGVDFEGSVPYHRLVLELFLWPALYRLRGALPVEDDYAHRLAAMADFVAAYIGTDGRAPLWGDADDARVLPFGGQDINDHRYLVGLVGAAFRADELAAKFDGPDDEVRWALGDQACSALAAAPAAEPRSQAFPHGGFFILADARNHVFIDCGPLGLAGRGGHGHNDLLAFAAALDGVPIVTDCGAYLYTANFRERNAFRSVDYHNTPSIDGEEIYRFTGERDLWTLRNDARAFSTEFSADPTGTSRFSGSHDGFTRLSEPVTVARKFALDHAACALDVSDDFTGAGNHDVTIPFHFAIGVETGSPEQGHLLLKAKDREFSLTWLGDGWRAELEDARVSPSYGVVVPTRRLVLRRSGPLAGLRVRIARTW